MAKPESLFCSMLEAEYNALVSSIEGLINLPAFALARLKSNIQRLINVFYIGIKSAILILEEQLIVLLGLDKIDQSESRLDFCRIAFECQALTELLFDPNNNLLSFLTPQQKQDIQSDYNEFEKYVCKIGLRGLIDNYVAIGLDAISNQLDLLEEKLLEQLGIDKLIQDYLTVLQDSGIFDLLNDFNKFAKCGFGICNFVTTSENKKSEYEDKLSVQQNSDGTWSFVDLDGSIQKLYALDDDASVSIAKMRASIEKYRNEKISDIKEGKSLDELMFP